MKSGAVSYLIGWHAEPSVDFSYWGEMGDNDKHVSNFWRRQKRMGSHVKVGCVTVLVHLKTFALHFILKILVWTMYPASLRDDILCIYAIAFAWKMMERADQKIVYHNFEIFYFHSKQITINSDLRFLFNNSSNHQTTNISVLWQTYLRSLITSQKKRWLQILGFDWQRSENANPANWVIGGSARSSAAI